MTKNHHNSVMFNESIDGLDIHPHGIYVDATFGRGGHTQGILNQLGDSGQVIAFDHDIDAIDFAKSNFNDLRLSVIHSNFSKLHNELERLNLIGKIDGILMDLGVSSPQLDHAERGFSFNKDGALDMRMDQTQPLTAAQWLKESSEVEIVMLFTSTEKKKEVELLPLQLRNIKRVMRLKQRLI